MVRNDDQLAAILFRLNCPDPGDLLNYAWQLLPEEKMIVVGAHLVECPHCPVELEELLPPVDVVEESATGDLAVQHIWEKMKLVVGQILPEVSALPATRSKILDEDASDTPNSSATRFYEVKELGWDVVIKYWLEMDNTYILQGQVLGVASDQADKFKASLVQEDRLIHQTHVNDVGVFRFSSVSKNSYTLCFYSDQVQVYIPGVVFD